MNGYLVDTSVFVAEEQRRPRGDLPSGQSRISVATLTELTVGVRMSEANVRALRERTLAKARSYIALPYDEFVSERLADIIGAARRGRRRVDLFDAIIAATALVHDLAVWTQDADFEVLGELAPELNVLRA